MNQKIMTAVKLNIPRDRHTFRKVTNTLREFELSHPSPSATHIDIPTGTMSYRFDSSRDALYFGNWLRNVTPISYASGSEFEKLRGA